MSRTRRVCQSLVIATGLAAAGPALAIDAPHYVDEAASAGITHTYVGGWEFFVGGGVAAFDCDGDQFLDLYFAGGVAPAALYRNRSEAGGTLRFEAVDEPAAALTEVTGAYPLDIDGDHVLDLAVLRLGEDVLLRGLGGCRFERANEMLGFAGGSEWTTAFSAIWEAGQTLPTLAFGNYVDRNQEGAPFGTCHDNYVYRPQGDHYGERTALSPGYCTLSMLFSDWNRDGVPDLRISNDRQYYRGGEEELYRFPPEGPPVAYGQGDGWRQLKIWGMGIASYDITDDGYPEYFLTSMADNKMQALDPTALRMPLVPTYDDIAFELGATAHRPYVGDDVFPSTAWHAEFDDVNNDGFIDLFITKGNVEGMLDFAKRDPNNLLLGQPDRSFREAGEEAGIATFLTSRGAAVVDLNMDGLLDLVVVKRKDNVELWRNQGAGEMASGGVHPMGNWSMIQLEQPGANYSGIGAWIEIKSGAHLWRREVSLGGGHASGEAGWVHFGVGAAERLEVRVQWPDGQMGQWVRTFSNNFLLLRRDNERPLLWLPPTPQLAQGDNQP